MKYAVLWVVALTLVAAFATSVGAADEVSGTYMSKENKNEYITFSADGKFYLKQQKKQVGSELPSFESIEGTYRLEGESMTLRLPDGGEAVGKIRGGVFMDNERRLWIKEGAQKKPSEVGIPIRKR